MKLKGQTKEVLERILKDLKLDAEQTYTELLATIEEVNEVQDALDAMTQGESNES